MPIPDQIAWARMHESMRSKNANSIHDAFQKLLALLESEDISVILGELMERLELETHSTEGRCVLQHQLHWTLHTIHSTLDHRTRLARSRFPGVDWDAVAGDAVAHPQTSIEDLAELRRADGTS